MRSAGPHPARCARRPKPHQLLPLPPRLTGIGVGIGLAFAWALGYVVKLLRWRGAKPYIESLVVLATAYLAFYVAQVGAAVRWAGLLLRGAYAVPAAGWRNTRPEHAAASPLNVGMPPLPPRRALPRVRASLLCACLGSMAPPPATGACWPRMPVSRARSPRLLGHRAPVFGFSRLLGAVGLRPLQRLLLEHQPASFGRAHLSSTRACLPAPPPAPPLRKESGIHEAVWDTVAFAANALVFFWSGISSVNFVARWVAIPLGGCCCQQGAAAGAGGMQPPRHQGLHCRLCGAVGSNPHAAAWQPGGRGCGGGALCSAASISALPPRCSRHMPFNPPSH